MTFQATYGRGKPAVFRGVLAGGSGVTLNTTINWTSVEDTHGGYSAGSYTVKVPGLYLANVGAKQSTAVAFGINVRKNGTLALYSPNSAAAAFNGLSLTGTIRLAAGDVVIVQSNTTFTTQSDAPADNNFFNLILIAP